MSLSRAEIEKVALLGRLLLSESEAEHISDQLAEIVDYVDQLAAVDTEGVEPMAHAFDLSNVFADDTVQPSLPREEALANAPHHDDESYLVPAVL